MMIVGRFTVFLSVLLLNLGPTLSSAQGQPANGVIARCDALKNADFSRIPDAITQIKETKLVPLSGATAGYCEIKGSVAPRVGFLLRLPSDHWNGKFIEIGCGGPCGSTAHVSACDDPVSRGYACIVSDGGTGANGIEMTWAYNNPRAIVDYFIGAPHLAALAGKAIVEHYYAKEPRKSYFMGCSSGGIQAMWMAQRFPWDFDGIVAGGPALHLTGSWMNFVWINRALMGETGEPLFAQADLEGVHAAVVDKCDLNDGVKDGLIGDPRACRFDPVELRCGGHKKRQCLTAQQIEAVEKIYAGPTTSRGEKIAMPIAMRGSEKTWLDFFGGSPVHSTPFYNYIGEWFRYYFFQPNPGPAWQPQAFDFDQDYKRLGMAEISETFNSQDLRRFKARGGKLLSYTGWNDALEGVLSTADYYETAERIIGSRAETQDFFRLFMIPGMNHCSGGDGAFSVDYLSYIEAWVERGEAPEKLIGSHLAQEDPDRKYMFGRNGPSDPAQIEFSRPIYPYPSVTRYMGRGDPKKAASFGPAKP